MDNIGNVEASQVLTTASATTSKVMKACTGDPLDGQARYEVWSRLDERGGGWGARCTHCKKLLIAPSLRLLSRFLDQHYATK